MEDHDFGGYATVYNRKCSDGRTIAPEAFAHMDGKQIPLVWQHQHNSVGNVLGHAYLKHMPKGLYAYGYFNETKNGQDAKILVGNNDLDSLSIYADGLRHDANARVLHGSLTELSLVLKGANDKARIDFVRLAHGDGEFEESNTAALIYSGETLEHAGDAGKTVQDVYDTLDADQIDLVKILLGQAAGGSLEHSADDEDDKDKKDKPESADDGILAHGKGGQQVVNVFDQNKGKNKSGGGVATLTDVLGHEKMGEILAHAKKSGKFMETFLQHAGEMIDDVMSHAEGDYGITNIEMLFPDAKMADSRPEFITRRMEWVEDVVNATKKLPWSKIKSMSADLTHEEARAKGYIKSTLKKEQFFEIASRETGPKTFYKKQKLDRDDIIDITDFDVVVWMWFEMYFMLREEFARAILVGDGREVDDDNKITETKIRPIAHDDQFYTDVRTIAANSNGEQMVEAVVRNRHYYKGTAPNAYMTTEVMNDMLLAKTPQGIRLYKSKAELAGDLQVGKIVEVPIMEGQTRDGGEILMIIVNLSDYSVGSTKGGEITKFQQFDIDYNQEKMLIEARASGTLTRHKTAQVILRGTGTLATLTAPTFNSGTGVVTIPTVTGVTYKNQDTQATLSAGAQSAIGAGTSISIVAVPNSGYYFPHNSDADWTFTRPA